MMAHWNHRLPSNVPGAFFVDRSCIDCQLCHQLAPETFHAHGDQTVVYHQPRHLPEVHRALMALVACPTASIGNVDRPSLHRAVEAFPEEIAAGVYSCGFASRHSYGAASYLLVRPTGNVLIDSPRFCEPLARRLTAL